MKKVLALLISMSMAASFTTAFAQSESVQTEVSALQQESEERREEDRKTAEDIRLRREERRKRAEAAETAVLYEAAELNASTVTLSGTVSLPDGCEALEDSYVSVRADRVGDGLGDGYIDAGNIDRYYAYADLENGKSSVKYSLELPPDNYIIRVSCDGSCENTILGNFYYRESGLVSYMVLAEVIDISSDKKLDITLKEAESTISGTITLTNPLPEDGHMCLYANTYMINDDIEQQSRIDIPVEAGQSEVAYTLPVYAGKTYVEVEIYSETYYDWEYFSITDTLSDEVRYFDTASKSYENVDYIYNSEPYEEEEEGETFPVKVTLNKVSTEYTDVEIELLDSDGYYIDNSYDWVEVNPGQQTVTVYLPQPQEDFYVSLYLDGRSYYSKEYGLVTDFGMATLLPADTKSLHIRQPESYTISGSVNRNGVLEGAGIQAWVYVRIGEEYIEEDVYIDADADSTQYSIEIPKYLAGSEAELYTEVFDMIGTAQTITITGDKTINLDLFADATTEVEGKLILTKPAPAGGVGVRVYVRGEINNYFYIPEGETELSYNAVLDKDGYDAETGILEYNIRLYSEEIEYTGRVYAEFNPEAPEANTTEFEVLDYTTISGKIKVPEDVELTSGVTCRVRAQDTDREYYRTYATIDKSEKECSFTLTVPKNISLRDLYCRVDYNGTSPVTDNEIRWEYNGSTDWDEVSVGEGIEDVEFVLERAKVVSGKLVIPEDVEVTDDTYAYVNLYNPESGESYESNGIEFTDKEAEFNVVLPYELSGDVVIEYVVEGNDDLYNGYVYYTENGATEDDENAAVLSLEDVINNGITLNAVKNKAVINVKAIRDESIDINESVDVAGNIEFNNEGYYVDLWLDEGAKVSKNTVAIPDTIENKDVDSYTVSYTANGDSFEHGDLYLTEDGVDFNAENAKAYPIDGEADIEINVCDASKYLFDMIESGQVTVSLASSTMENGEITGVVNVECDTYTFECLCPVMAAVYDSEGRLVEVEIQEIEIERYNSEQSFGHMVPEVDGFTYKLMLWNGTSWMKPIVDAVTF